MTLQVLTVQPDRGRSRQVTHPWPIFSILVYFLFGSPMLTIVFSRSSISSSDIFFLLCVVLLAVVGAVDVTDVVTDDGTGETTGTVVFLFLSRTGENGTVPLAILGNVSGTSSSTGFVYCNEIGTWLTNQSILIYNGVMILMGLLCHISQCTILVIRQSRAVYTTTGEGRTRWETCLMHTSWSWYSKSHRFCLPSGIANAGFTNIFQNKLLEFGDPPPSPNGNSIFATIRNLFS